MLDTRSNPTRHLIALCLAALMPLALAACDSSNDAGGGTNIDTGKGVGEMCELDVNCRSGLTCQSGTCQPAGTTTEGQPCNLTAECVDGLYCAPPIGIPPGTVDPPPFTCKPAGDALEGEPCEFTLDCEAGTMCLPDGFAMKCTAMGDTDLGGECTATTECFDGLTCLQGTCQNDTWFTPFDNWQRPTCPTHDGPARVLFEVPSGDVQSFYSLPFPSDIRLKGGSPDLSGHFTPPLEGFSGPVVERFIERIESGLDGFSENPTIFFRFSKSMDLETLEDGAGDPRFAIYDVTDPASEDYGKARGMSWAAATGPGSGGLYMCDNWLGLKLPWGRPLSPGGTYAVVLQRGIASGDGETFDADDDLKTMLATSTPNDATMAEAWEAFAPLRELIDSGAVSAADVVGATVFTVQTTEDIVPALRSAVRAEPAPEVKDAVLCDGNTVSPCDDGLMGEEHVRGCPDAPASSFDEVHARVTIPQFQEGTHPFEGPEDGGGIAVNGMGVPQVQSTADVCVSMAVPRQTMPDTGWPLIIYGHGSGGDFRSHIDRPIGELGATLTHMGTDAGAIVLGFDAPVHGDRVGESEVDPKDLYFNYMNPDAARGNVLQGVADLFQLARLGEDGVLVWDAASSPTGEELRVDPSKVYVVGHSQGTHYAPIAAAHEPGYAAMMISGAGGGLTLGMLEKTKPLNIAAGVRVALGDPDVNGFHPALALIQTWMDVADPINYAESILYEPIREQRPHVFHIIGVGDNYAPDKSQRALAVGLGSFLAEDGVVDPFGGVNKAMLPISENFSGVTAVARQYPQNDAYDGHFVAQQDDVALGDQMEFLSSLIATEAPVVEGE